MKTLQITIHFGCFRIRTLAFHELFDFSVNFSKNYLYYRHYDQMDYLLVDNGICNRFAVRDPTLPLEHDRVHMKGLQIVGRYVQKNLKCEKLGQRRHFLLRVQFVDINWVRVKGAQVNIKRT